MIKYFSNEFDWLMIKRNAIKRIDEDVKTYNFLYGKATQDLENGLKNFLGVKHCILTKSGTQALVVALKSCGIGQGDTVITTPFTFIASINAIKMVGAEPIFVDVKEDTFNIDENKIESKIQDNTKAILTVDIFGNPCNYDAICDIAKRYNLKVVDDMCQAMTAEYKGVKLGNVGDIACTSFYPTKPFGGFGEGGAIFTNDDDLYQSVWSFLNQGSDGNDNCVRIGTNGRFDMLHAVFLQEKMKYINQILDKRNVVADVYSQMEGVVWQKQEPNAVSAWARMQGVVKKESDLELIKTLFQTDDLYKHDVCDNTLYSKYRNEVPISAKISHASISFPMYTYLSLKDLQKAVDDYNSLRKK